MCFKNVPALFIPLLSDIITKQRVRHTDIVIHTADVKSFLPQFMPILEEPLFNTECLKT
jgi:hypothetical protein